MPAIRTAACLRPCGYSGHGTGKGTEQNGHFFYLWLSPSPTPPPCVSSRDFAAGYGPEPASQPATVRPARRNSRRHGRLGIRCLCLTPCRAAGGGAGSLVRWRRYAGGWCHPPPALLRPRFRPASPRRTGRWLGVTSPHARNRPASAAPSQVTSRPGGRLISTAPGRAVRRSLAGPSGNVSASASASASLPSHPSGLRKIFAMWTEQTRRER